MSDVKMDDILQNPKIDDMLRDVIAPVPNSCLEKILPAAGIALLAIGAVAVIANAISCDDSEDNPLVVR
jgi:hypothetical protein